MQRDLAALEKNLNYTFAERSLLVVALTHRSKRRRHNERLEFLGDAILGAVIAEALYHRFPHASEGQLSQMRMTLVKGDTLTRMARRFQLSHYMEFGETELKSGGYQRDRLLEDAFEALLGAIYLDGGFVAVRERILSWFDQFLAKIAPTRAGIKDAKTRLQELLQKYNYALPVYEVVHSEGKDHEKSFHVCCRLPQLDMEVTVVAGKRKSGENQAARRLLEQLQQQWDNSNGQA